MGDLKNLESLIEVYNDEHLKTMSRVKKERIKKKNMKEQVKKVENSLPVFNKEEIRRIKLPYHEALFCELMDKGLPSTADFLKQVIDYQEKERNKGGPESAIWSRKRLVECKTEIDILTDGLTQAEQSNNEGNLNGEIETFLNLGNRFSFGIEDWFWLGEQLLLQTLVLCEFYTEEDRGKNLATASFMYGMFLYTSTQYIDKSIQYLSQARELSLGTNWNVKDYFPTHTHCMFEESCMTLYEIYYAKARKVLKTNPAEANKYAVLARKRAKEACYSTGVTEALLVKGITDLVANNMQKAVSSMTLAFSSYLRIEYDPRLKQALDNLKKGQTIAALEILLGIKDSVNIEGLPYFVAQAYRYLGELQLSKGEAKSATPLLTTSLHLFNELNLLSEIEQVRNLAAISYGQELMPKYTDLIIKTQRKGREGLENLLRLVDWKDSRESFFNEEEISLPSGDSKIIEDLEIEISLGYEEDKIKLFDKDDDGDLQLNKKISVYDKNLLHMESFAKIGEEIVKFEDVPEDTALKRQNSATLSWFDDSSLEIFQKNEDSMFSVSQQCSNLGIEEKEDYNKVQEIISQELSETEIINEKIE